MDFKIYYKSGKLKAEEKNDSICKCGRLTEYFENGSIQSTKTYLHSGVINSQIDGEDIRYFENGTIQIYYFWNNGAPSGRIYANFPDGKLAYEKFFTDKFKTGTWKFYNEDGSLREEMIFTANKTPWDSNDDYAADKFYFDKKLAYTVELIAGKKTNLIIIDKNSYKNLTALEPTLGKKLFIQNCSMCHNAEVDVVGPKLKTVTKRRTNEWLSKMITNGDALVKSDDTAALALYKKWDQAVHPNFERFSKEELNAVIDYLETLK